MLVIKNEQKILEQDNYYRIIKDFKKLYITRVRYNKGTVSNKKVQRIYNDIINHYEEMLNLQKYHMIHLNFVEENDPYVDRAIRHLLMGLSNIIPEELLQ